jgi:hypothetical protein
MAFELKRFGIGMKTIEPGGMKTDFFTRSFDSSSTYGGLIERVMAVIPDPTMMASYSRPSRSQKLFTKQPTDGKEQLRYVAGADAKHAAHRRTWGRSPHPRSRKSA